MAKNKQIRGFIEQIAPTDNFANSRKIICTRTYKRDENGEMSEYFRRIAFFKQNSSEEYSRIDGLKFSAQRDYYITKNSFIAQQRSEETLFSFDNIVIDLDYHKHCGWKQIDFNVDKLLYLLGNDYKWEFPAFNAVKTGRGVQLWIALESFSGKLGKLYKHITEALCDKLQQVIKDNDIRLELDRKASVDACRVVRLPFTHNTHRKGYITQLVYRTDYRYDIDELLEYAEEKPKKPNIEHKRTVAGDWNGLNTKRIRFIEQLIANDDGDCSGRREVMAWLYYNSLIQLFDTKTAEDMLNKLNHSFTEPLRASQIRTITNQFYKKQLNIGTVKADGYTELGYYTIPSALWLDFLGCSEAERKEYYGTSHRDLDRKAARERKAERDERIAKLRAEGYTAEQVAEKVGCSVRTVKSKYKPDKATRDRLILTLHSEGLPPKSIADKAGCSVNTVRKVIQTHAQTFSEPHRDVSKAEGVDLPSKSSERLRDPIAFDYGRTNDGYNITDNIYGNEQLYNSG